MDQLTDMDPINEWRKRAAFFPGAKPLVSQIEPVPESNTPEPYRALLSHNRHMTAMMEQYHGSRVDVHVLARRTDETLYSRQIILTKSDTGAVVQFAFAHFDLNDVPEDIRAEILGEQIPLGRVLMSHGLECRIEVDAILKLTVAEGLAELLQCPVGVPTYGRIAHILCDGHPTFGVIEISTPLDVDAPLDRVEAQDRS